jgi:hypothetical protein
MINLVNTVQVNVFRSMLGLKFQRQYVVCSDDSFSITYTGVEELNGAAERKLNDICSNLILLPIVDNAKVEFDGNKVKLKVNLNS